VLGNLLTVIAFLGLLIFACSCGINRLDGNRLVDRHLRLSVRGGRMPGMGVSRNVASSDTVNPCLRGTLAQKSHGSNPAASISIYLSLGWIIFCAALTAANWATIGQDVKAHPKEWVALLVVCTLMQYPVIWYWVGDENAGWLRRRKLAELNEVDDLPPGNYRITINAAGFALAQADVSVAVDHRPRYYGHAETRGGLGNRQRAGEFFLDYNRNH
jgi:hypothetical protein